MEKVKVVENNNKSEEAGKIRDIFGKAKLIVGLEPISDDDIKGNFEETGNKEVDEYKAMKLAVIDYL